jgi:hypothetical protein
LEAVAYAGDVHSCEERDVRCGQSDVEVQLTEGVLVGFGRARPALSERPRLRADRDLVTVEHRSHVGVGVEGVEQHDGFAG